MDEMTFVTNIEETVEALDKQQYILKDPHRDINFIMIISLIADSIKDTPDKIGFGRLVAHMMNVVRNKETEPDKLAVCLGTCLSIIKKHELPLFIYAEDYPEPYCYKMLSEFYQDLHDEPEEEM